MIVKKLLLKDFRNYEELSLTDIDPKINLILGENAQGKTNLIEAIYFLSCGRSFRSATEERLIREGCSAAYLKAEYETASSRGKMEAALFHDKKRSVKINGVAVRKMSEIIGRINTVVFAPEDMKTINESPSLRRRLVDIEISKLSPSYYVSLQRYMAALKEKNRLLKEERPSFDLIDLYNMQLAEHGAKLIRKREEFLNHIGAHACEIHSYLTDNTENLLIKYRPSAEVEEAQRSLSERLTANFSRECDQRISVIGPHREDFDIFINERDAKLMASQGQQRTAMISIKLACAKTAVEYCSEKPVLLLDDVFSELDKKRAERLMNVADDFQVFITSADAESFHGLKNGKIIKVSAGRIFS